MRLSTVLLPTVTIAMLSCSIQPGLGEKQVITEGSITDEIVPYLLVPEDSPEIYEVFTNQLPSNLPVSIPVPENASILTSIVYRLGNASTATQYHQMLLNVQQPPDVLAAQYGQQLEALGWSPIETNPRGFLQSGPLPDYELHFCQFGQGGLLNLKALIVSQEESTTNLVLLLSPRGVSPCRPDTEGSPISEPVTPMPLLMPMAETNVAPPDTGPLTTVGTGVGFVTSIVAEERCILGIFGCDTHSSVTSADVIIGEYISSERSETVIESELGATDIAQHYAKHWEAAGWRMLDSNESNGAVQSIWAFEDEFDQLWQGKLTIEPIENEPGKYAAIASVELQYEEEETDPIPNAQ